MACPSRALEGGKVRVFEELDESTAASIGSRLRRGPQAFEAESEARPTLERRAGLRLELGSRRAS
jgi:hypothetical protein